MHISFETIAGQQQLESVEYSIYVVDSSGVLVNFIVVEVDKISSQIHSIDKSLTERFFPAYSRNVPSPLKEEIKLLIGMQYSRHENLVLLENAFGLLVAGSCNSNKHTVVDRSVLHMRHAVVMHVAGVSEKSFFEIEGLGVACNPRCGSCKCGTCHPGGKNMSLQEEREYDIMNSNVTFDTVAGRFISKYPWNENRNNLEYNKPMALAVMKSTENQLQKKGKQYTDLYSSQIVDMINRKAAREVTEEELKNYIGQKYFLTHLAVQKPDSKTTPLRIVFNSRARY